MPNIRLLLPGELVLRDEPFCAGPSVTKPRGIICVECFIGLRSVAFPRCHHCGLPLCDTCLARKGLTFWHFGLECPALRKIEFRSAEDTEVLLRQVRLFCALHHKFRW